MQHVPIGRRRRSARPDRRRAILGAGLALAASVTALPAAALASSGPKATTLSPLEQGLKFYRGKTITMLTYGALGTGVDLTGRTMAPAMASYLHATINVVNISIANGITEQDDLAKSPPDGLTFGQLNVATDISNQIANLPGLNFNPTRLAFIGASPSGSAVWIANPTSPYTTWKAVEESKTPVPMLDTTTGDGNLRLRVVNGAFGLNANVISGYGNTAALTQGFLRGDGAVTENALSVFSSLILSGKAVPILLTTKNKFTPALAAKLRGVPTLAEVAAKYPPKGKEANKALQALLGLLEVGVVNAAPTATPPDRLLALKAAFKAASLDKDVEAAVLNAGSEPGWISGPQAKVYWLAIANNTGALAHYLNA